MLRTHILIAILIVGCPILADSLTYTVHCSSWEDSYLLDMAQEDAMATDAERGYARKRFRGT